MRRGVWIVLAGFLAVGISIYILSTPVVVIGVAVSSKATFSAPEGAMLSVVQSYVSWHNSKKNPYRLKLEVARFDGDMTDAMEDLAERGAVVVVGFPFSWEAIAAAEIAERLKIPVVSPTASSSRMSGKDDWFFRVAADTEKEGKVFAKMLSFLAIDNPVVYRSPYNDVYVGDLINGMGAFSEDISSDVVVYPEVLGDSVSGDGVVIIAEPSRSYWILQDVRLHYPPVPIILSLWSQVSDFEYFFDIPDEGFYFPSVYDPTSIPGSEFVRFLKNDRELDMGSPTRYTIAAMTYLSSVFARNPEARGDTLRSMLAEPVTLDAPGWTLKLDAYGDAESDIRIFHFGNGIVEEVTVP